ncbi:hypothetical protein FVE85_5854 [Porphyridium purpureum]|uniref:Uncharacterized protein n=1 Tax=Porphyridium purpureum TaxID=35688 RepID=A0A5J4Z2T5_PORPP|nr:hypothetical protein FVE85_5854 [Porphyridium purpureum]|eukprot:POR1623..scf295_1
MAFVSHGWHARTERGSSAARVCMVHEQPAVSRRALLGGCVAAAVAAAAAVSPPEALADRDLMTAKRSYFRYATRAESGIDWFVTDLYPAVQEQKWDAVLDAFAPRSDARDNSKKAEYGIDRKVSNMQRFLFDPLTIWAQSFAEKGTGPNFRYLASQEKEFEEQMDRLRRIAKGDKLDFSKQNAGLSRQDAALDAWNKGRDAINLYLARANANLSRELRRLDSIPDDLSTYKTHGDRPKAYGTFQ